VSAGKLRTGHEDRLDEARERLAAAEDAVRDDDEIRVDLPATRVPSGRGVLTLRGVEVRYGARADLLVRGPERIALTGRNGAGKTTLLRTIVGLIPAVSGEVKVGVPAAVVRGAAVLPWRVARGQPRRAVPPRDRPYALAAPGRGAGRDRSAVAVRPVRPRSLTGNAALSGPVSLATETPLKPQAAGSVSRRRHDGVSRRRHDADRSALSDRCEWPRQWAFSWNPDPRYPPGAGGVAWTW